MSKQEKLQLNQVVKEVSLLRSMIIGLVGKDAEGDYQPSFVRRILKRLEEKPNRTFKDAKSFLKELEKQDG